MKTSRNYLSFVVAYLSYYFSFAIFSCLIAVYLMDKGYSASETSLVVSGSFLSSMIAQPIIGSLSDRFSLKSVNSGTFFLAAVGGLCFAYADTLWELILGYSLVLALINGSNPVLEKFATISPFKYGSIRVWGTIGYALGSQAAGLVYDWISPRAIFFTFVITMLISIGGLALTHPDDRKQAALEKAKQTEENHEDSHFLSLFKNRLFVQYLFISAIFYSLMNMANTYIPAMFQARGLAIHTVSNILFWAVLCEVPVVFFSYLFMDRFSNKVLLIVPTCIVLAQFLSFGLNLYLPIQIFWTFLAKHPAGMVVVMMNLKVVATLIPAKHQMTALALIQTVRNLASIFAQTIFGVILEHSNYQVMFSLAALTLSVALVLLIFYKIPKRPKENIFS